MRDTYTPHDWCWIIGDNEGRHWSSAVGGYVDGPPGDEAGVTLIASEAELDEVLAQYGLPGPSALSPLSRCAAADVERDRRVALGFSFGETRFQARPEDLANINGAVSAALIAISLGAQPGDLRWGDPDADFAWLSIDNVPVPMDAQTVLAFGQAALTHKSRLIWKGRAIKDEILAGTFEGDVTADDCWSS